MRDTLPKKVKLNECGILNLGRLIFWRWYIFGYVVQQGKDKYYFDSYRVQPPSELIAYLKSKIANILQ